MNSTESAKRPYGNRPKKRKFTATRGLLATDHVILNHGQVTWTTPELAPPLLTTTPHQREDVSALDRFNVHRCPTRRVFSGTEVELVTRQATIRYLYHSATAAIGGDIKLSEKCVRGLSSVFSIECKNCKYLCSFRNSKMLGKRKNIPEINRRFVYAMRTIGQGHAAMTTFCGVMDFPPPVAEKSYNNIINKLQLCSKEVAEASMQSAALGEVTDKFFRYNN
ncbi:uncharacterized protein TNCV_2388861 [Trichonephila clavipes]|nr:uncharacterized protein TNCV_2388861 [Trichonephila clavipes]